MIFCSGFCDIDYWIFFSKEGAEEEQENMSIVFIRIGCINTAYILCFR